MKEWDITELDGSDSHHHRGRKFNKEKYCKRNKKGHGQYGPHMYGENHRCTLCNKIDPHIKYSSPEG